MTDPDRPRTKPEGHTPEEPRPSEIGKLGSPGTGRTSDVPHAADAERVESGEEHTALGDDGHGHAEPRVGPVDWGAWAYATLGVLSGLLVVGLFGMASR
ncbi:MAG TPA: hypothetical protein VMP67_00130 [Candidatus Limnocylindria bacterium]|nr:hypothetical protein [Candidatus Limnocylindria bacterium]